MVCSGSLNFAKATYRVLTEQSLDQINMAFYGAGNDALSELYQASGLDPYFRFAVTTAIKTMADEESRKNKSEPDKPVNEIVREIVSFYRGIAPTSIEQVIASLCHEADRWRQPEPAPESAS